MFARDCGALRRGRALWMPFPNQARLRAARNLRNCHSFLDGLPPDGSTLTYCADDNTDWNVSGTISNAIIHLGVTLTFPVVWVWRYLDMRGKEPATPTKMAGIGMTLTGLSFFILFFARVWARTRRRTNLCILLEIIGSRSAPWVICEVKVFPKM